MVPFSLDGICGGAAVQHFRNTMEYVFIQQQSGSCQLLLQLFPWLYICYL